MRNGLNILIAEADDAAYETLSGLLDALYGSSLCLVRANDMTATLETINSHRGWYFDVCFIGAVADQQVGIQTLQAIIDDTECKAPLVFLSSQEDIALEQAALDTGADDTLIIEGLVLRELARVVRYVTNQRRAREREERLVYHDDLTSLPNRRLLQDRLEQVLVRARRRTVTGILMLLDLDNFKTINDSLGHSVGDQLLREVSVRLQTCCRREDTVARIGGDEFVLLLPDCGQDAAEAVRGARKVAENVLRALADPILIDKHNLHVTVSIGLTVLNADSASVDAVLRQADTAMYEAKSSGKDSYRFFALEMEELVLNQVRIESHLRLGLIANEFYLNYQPIVDTQTLRLVGAEALVRWNNPMLGQVSPAVFVPIAETCGLIWALGEKILEEACQFLKATPGLPQLSVNISGEQIHRTNFVPFVRKVIEETGIAPGRLVFELTETTFLADLEQAADAMEQLRTLGIRFALDDFGTGYSSLSYLKRLPFDYVKIDHSFTRGVIENTDDQAIIQAILSLGEVLGFMVTAEGVETEEQMEFLQMRGCSSLQGYYFSRPLGADDFTKNWASLPIADYG